MSIDPDVQIAAERFGLDPVLVQAVVRAEGDIVKAVQCSIPSVQTRDKALDVLCRSCVHALRDFVQSRGEQSAFIQFWGARWAPVGATNDPQALNANWVHNVSQLSGARTDV